MNKLKTDERHSAKFSLKWNQMPLGGSGNNVFLLLSFLQKKFRVDKTNKKLKHLPSLSLDVQKLYTSLGV